ncbi:MAG: LuxR C-terminal-related transcriptional regulator, partial [Bacteroidales bacterium]|jgi:LuxR family maltose regulon positive regulatory protein|nr:LuxR C-terminal-related transcriptional regulator [Bacteroidales bacterium]
MTLLLEVEAYYSNCNSISSEMKRRIEGEIELIQAYVAFNDISLMHMKMKKAHKLLEGKSLIANKDKIITFGSPHTVYLYYKDLGKLLWTVESLEKTFPYYHELSGGCGKGFEYQIRGEYYLEIGDLKDAEINAYKSLYKARTLHQYPVIICSNFVLARIRVAEERYEEAIDIVQELSAEIDGLNRPTLSSELDLFAGYMGGILGQEDLYAKWLRTDEIDKSDVLYQGMGINYIVYGKYLLLKKEFLKLEILCEEMQIVFSYNNNQLGFLHMNILKAIAKHKLYGFQAAEKHLYGALIMGEADGIITPIVEYGRDLMALFESDNRNHGSESYWNLLQTRIKPYINCYEPVVPIEFTKREKEIVQLIIDGKTNKKIAQQLFLAEVTVRKNITIIYRKLNVIGRTSAVKKIMELKII